MDRGIRETADAEPRRVMHFGTFDVDLTARTLLKGGVRIRLQDQPFRVLKLLLEQPGAVVSRDELQRELWPNEEYGAFDLGLNTAIRKLRRALNDSADNPIWIETVPKVGYRFLGPVGEIAQAASTETTPARPPVFPEQQLESSRSPHRPRRRRLEEHVCEWQSRDPGDGHDGVMFVGWIPWGIAAAACVAAAAGWVSSAGDSRDVRAFELAPPAGTVLSGFSDPASGRMAFALSPDGRELAFVAREDDGVDDLYVRTLGSLESRRVAEGARHPFWSPDGEHLGYFTPGRELMRVRRNGGPPLKIADVGGGVRSGTWGRDRSILFSQVSEGEGIIFRVMEDGGTPHPVTELNPERGEVVHRWPQFLPGGETFLYFARTDRSDRSAVLVGGLDGRAPRVLFENRSAATYANGYLLFTVDGSLSARTFDPTTGELGASIRTIAGEVEETRYSNPVVSVAESGVLAYSTGGEGQRLVWFDRSGRRLEALDELSVPASIFSFRISPDQTTVAASWVTPGGVGSHIWLSDVARRTWRRWTSDPTHHLGPQWSPDGKEIAYASPRGGTWRVYARPLDVPVEPRPLWTAESSFMAYVADWSSELLIVDSGATLVVRSTGEAVRKLADEGVRTSEAAYSPDGEWIAYVSSEGGDNHIFVQSASGTGPRVRVSPSFGVQPRWRRSDEIVYQGTDGYYSAPVAAGSGTITVGEARFLFAIQAINYDVSRDHQRFLLAMPKPEPGYITVETDWLSALR